MTTITTTKNHRQIRLKSAKNLQQIIFGDFKFVLKVDDIEI